MAIKDQEIKIKKLLELYKDVPFVHNGRSLEGLDCLGFVIHFYKHFGINLPNDDGKEIDEDWYKHDPQRYIRSLRKLDGIQVSLNDLQALDLVYFSISRGIITHTGVMINQHEFAHMSPKSSFLISKMERHWKNRCRGAIRFPKLV
jgi:cell wall-associated NlpC family hydrolase